MAVLFRNKTTMIKYFKIEKCFKRKEKKKKKG